MRKESWGQFVEFPDSYFACSGRSDRRAWEKNLRRKKNKRRLEASHPLPFFEGISELAINPLNPKSDQYQNSPSDINALQNRLLMRFEDMIIKDKDTMS